MTNIEKRIENRLVEDKYAEKFHQLDMEETLVHINSYVELKGFFA